MSDFLNRLVDRARGEPPAIRPLLRTLYEPAPGAAGTSLLDPPPEGQGPEDEARGPNVVRGERIAAAPAGPVAPPAPDPAGRALPPAAPVPERATSVPAPAFVAASTPGSGPELSEPASVERPVGAARARKEGPAPEATAPAEPAAQRPGRREVPARSAARQAPAQSVDESSPAPAHSPSQPPVTSPGAAEPAPDETAQRTAADADWTRAESAPPDPSVAPLPSQGREDSTGVIHASPPLSGAEPRASSASGAIRVSARVAVPAAPVAPAGAQRRSPVPASSLSPAGDVAPAVQITIGRLEIRAAMPTARSVPANVIPAPPLSLAEYLKRSAGGGK